MTRINNIGSINYKKPLITPKNTGYAAAGAILLAMTRTFISAKPVRKTHKFIGLIATALTLLHIGVVEYFHNKYKRM